MYYCILCLLAWIKPEIEGEVAWDPCPWAICMLGMDCMFALLFQLDKPCMLPYVLLGYCCDCGAYVPCTALDGVEYLGCIKEIWRGDPMNVSVNVVRIPRMSCLSILWWHSIPSYACRPNHWGHVRSHVGWVGAGCIGVHVHAHWVGTLCLLLTVSQNNALYMNVFWVR